MSDPYPVLDHQEPFGFVLATVGTLRVVIIANQRISRLLNESI